PDDPRTTREYSFTPHNNSPLTSLFFHTDPPTTEIYTLSLHDALPISDAVTAVTSDVGIRCPEQPQASGNPPKHRKRPVSRMPGADRKSTRLNSSHVKISYAVFCLKKKKNKNKRYITIHIENLI